MFKGGRLLGGEGGRGALLVLEWEAGARVGPREYSFRGIQDRRLRAPGLLLQVEKIDRHPSK